MHPVKAPEIGGLPTTRRPDQSRDPLFGDREINILESLEMIIIKMEPLDLGF
jgi:hypothetical protein